MILKPDCFAYVNMNKCAALITLDCENCRFYKKKGTECDTCSYKGSSKCIECRMPRRS